MDDNNFVLSAVEPGDYLLIEGDDDYHKVLGIYPPDIITTLQYALSKRNGGLDDILAVYKKDENGGLILKWSK